MVKKKGISLTFQKTDLFLISAVFIFLVAVGFVIATNSGNPAVMGHSLNEIALPSCSTGQVLKQTSTGWACGDDSVGSASSLSCLVQTTFYLGDNGIFGVYKWPDSCPSGYTLMGVTCAAWAGSDIKACGTVFANGNDNGAVFESTVNCKTSSNICKSQLKCCRLQ